MAAFGRLTRPALVRGVAATPGAFPLGAQDYTALGGAITVPFGSLDTWWRFTPAASATTRRALVTFGDSTTYGSGGLYSWLSRIRARAVTAGYTDGGKGIFAGLEQELVYDAPEVNGIVSSTFAGSADAYDTLVGSWIFDAAGATGHQSVTQFRETNLRLWYMRRIDAGDFTYSIAAGGSVVASGTISASQSGNPNPVFRWLPGLPAGLKTLTITNTGGGSVRVAIDPVNDTGLQVQKQAMSGATFGGFFYAGLAADPFTQSSDGFRFQAPMGLVPNVAVQGSNSYAGMTVDMSYPAAARIAPCLAVTDLGFNDLTSAASFSTAYWVEYVRRFAAACRAASCSGLVLSGQLPYNANWPTYGAARFTAVKTEALAQGLAFADLFYPIGGPSLSYTGGASNPHLTKDQYIQQADFLWDNLLGV